MRRKCVFIPGYQNKKKNTGLSNFNSYVPDTNTHADLMGHSSQPLGFLAFTAQQLLFFRFGEKPLNSSRGLHWALWRKVNKQIETGRQTISFDWSRQFYFEKLHVSTCSPDPPDSPDHYIKLTTAVRNTTCQIDKALKFQSHRPIEASIIWKTLIERFSIWFNKLVSSVSTSSMFDFVQMSEKKTNLSEINENRLAAVIYIFFVST